MCEIFQQNDTFKNIIKIILQNSPNVGNFPTKWYFYKIIKWDFNYYEIILLKKLSGTWKQESYWKQEPSETTITLIKFNYTIHINKKHFFKEYLN